VEFRGFVDVIQAQTTAALCHYLGVSREQEFEWTQAFSKDPYSPFDGTAQPIHHTVSQDFAAYSRAMKAVYVTPRELAPAATLQQHKRSEALQFIFHAYLQPYLNFARGDTDIITVGGLDFMDDLFLVYSDLLGRPPTAEETVAFLQSKQMVAVPFVDVYSSLRAAMALDRERKAKGSDLNDVLIAATALPYCDVFATDGHMKHLIVALKLDKRYNVAVFGSRKADVLALTSLIRDL